VLCDVRRSRAGSGSRAFHNRRFGVAPPPSSSSTSLPPLRFLIDDEPSFAEARKKEDAEWELAFSSAARDRNGNDDGDGDYDGTSSSLAPWPSTSPTAASEDDYASFGDFISSSPPAPWEALPETTP
jgi:hypothetical protein